MDDTLVDSIRKNLATKSTDELRQAYESADKAAMPAEELEAMRLVLDERRSNGNRTLFAISSAIVFGALGAVAAWWQGADGAFIFLAGVVCAVLAFSSWYIPHLISQV